MDKLGMNLEGEWDGCQEAAFGSMWRGPSTECDVPARSGSS